MRPDDVPAAERLSAVGFHDLDLRLTRRSWPEPELRPANRGANWIVRTRHFIETDPGGCWVAEDETGTDRGRDVVQPGEDVVPGDVRRAARPPGPRDRQAAAGGGAPPRRRIAAGDVVGVVGPAGRAPLPARRLLAPSADVAARPGRPLRHPGRREGARGQRRRHRPDGLHRPADPRRRPRPRPRGHAGLLAVGGVGHARPARGTSTSTRTEECSCSRRPIGVPRPACCGRRSPTAATRPSIDHITTANEWAIDVGIAARLGLYTEGYLGLRDMKPPAPYLHNGALL